MKELNETKTNNKQGIRYDFTLLAVMLIPVGVALNFVTSQVVQVLRIPIHLDTVGTIIVSMIAGPWVGATTGLTTNLVTSLTNPTSIFFAPVSISVGIIIGFSSKYRLFNNIIKTILLGFIIALTSVIIGSFISVIVFGGATGKSIDAVTGLLLVTTQDIWKSVLSSSLLINSIDKILSVLIGYFMVKKMSNRYLSKMNYGVNFLLLK
ncbi:ECF transporter S component [Tetragenococcus halophilus]|uniref:ECF transporter S component n=1 Tax=Tetragenococcus halophilus TaxID=51669 RepID=UPI002A9B4DF5|nr:ABC transporter permease [Tetragenococcus halophilus]